MDAKLIKRFVIVASVFTCIGFGNITRLNGIESVKAIHVVSLITLGVGIGALIISIVLLIKSRKHK